MKIADKHSIAEGISNRLTHTQQSSTFEVNFLESDLRALIRGEVRFDAGSRALYATDSSNYRQVPVGVVIPKEVDDVYMIRKKHYGC